VRAHGVDGLLMSRARLVAVLGAELARRVPGDDQALGEGSQVSEVVQADAAHEAAFFPLGREDSMARALFDAPICP